jgi:hypothetical protein
MTLSARALSLLPLTFDPALFRMVPNVEGTPLTLRLVASYAAQNPGLEFGNYCSDWRDTEGRRAYFSESRAITRDLRRVRDALRGAYFAGVTDADMIEASRHAFSGRLTIKARDAGGFGIEYCTGQYWPTEYRKACAAVLEYAARIAAHRTAEPVAA